MFFRFSSAAEAIVSYIIIFNVFPSIYRKRNRSSFYPRLCVTYVLILLIILIRFYDFLESNIFRTMQRGHKIRFLLYGLATIEAMFDLSLVALGIEILLEVSNTVLTEKRKWVLFGAVAGGVPVAFLFLILIIWESNQHFDGVLGVALAESIIPGISLSFIAVSVYFFARRKKMSLSEDFLLRVKIDLLINGVALVGMLLNLLLYSLNAEVVMDDLIDAIVKLGVATAYILAQPQNFVSTFLLPSLDIPQSTMENSTQPIVLQTENEAELWSNNSPTRTNHQPNQSRSNTANGHTMQMVC